MKHLNFPFTAILGQDRMKKALILNVIDPSIGGVLLTGHQGTGKSTAVRSLTDILPDIEFIQDCPFSCDPNEKIENLCDLCKQKLTNNIGFEKSTKPITLVNLPLGVTEDMVAGSLDLELVLKKGIKSLHPGLLAKANRGILYIDEINLLQDHIVDILLDSAALGVNIIEREGVSISHPSKFILIGSMNPEEGELRPQINDRLGLEVTIEAPVDPKIRAEITKRVIQFGNNPNNFCEKFKKKQAELKSKIKKAREIVFNVEIPDNLYDLASELVSQLGVQSQRADITLIRCARASAAFRGAKLVELIDLNEAIDLVFEHRMRVLRDDLEPEEIKDKIKDVYSEIKKAYENLDIYKPNRNVEGPMKSTDQPQDEFRTLPFNEEFMKDVPEIDDFDKKTEQDTSDWERDHTEGIKSSGNSIKKFTIEELKTVPEYYQKRISNILSIFKDTKKISNFSGRGNRIKITSSQKGRYISYRTPSSIPKNIAFDASIKKSLIRNYCADTDLHINGLELNHNSPISPINHNESSNYIPNEVSNCVNFPIQIQKEDMMEKVFEYKAPLSVYFILDASGSMNRYLSQMTDVISSLHRIGYEKKDKTSIIIFKGIDAVILQRPTTNLSRVISKLPSIKATSNTPLASALVKVENMIKSERIKNRDTIPVIVICSDLGANISLKFPNMRSQSNDDFDLICDELNVIAKRLGKKRIKTLVMIPKKGRATKYLGLNPFVVDKIKDDLKKYARAEFFEFDGYNPRETIIKLKKIL